MSAIYLFGSRALGNSRENSDYDFGILLKDPTILRNGTLELYQVIYDLLEDIVGERKNLDIIFLDQAPLQLRYQVINHGIVLYDRDPLQRGRFVEKTLEEHADMEPHRKIFEEAVLARIA